MGAIKAYFYKSHYSSSTASNSSVNEEPPVAEVRVESAKSEDTSFLEQELATREAEILLLKKQIKSMGTDINRKHNEQQSQLQGVEAVRAQSSHLSVYSSLKESELNMMNSFK